MSRKSVLISSLLHSIATNYNSEVSDIVGDKLTFTVIISIVNISTTAYDVAKKYFTVWRYSIKPRP